MGILLFIYLSMAVLAPHCCAWAFLVAESEEYSVVVHGLLFAVASLVVAHRLSCSKACGIFLDQG